MTAKSRHHTKKCTECGQTPDVHSIKAPVIVENKPFKIHGFKMPG